MTQKFWIICFFGFALGCSLFLLGCGDLVQEDESTSGCSSALNDRDYDTAISKCTARKDKAAAYLGRAGYDIINVLEASNNSAKAVTDTNATDILGAETVSFVFTVNTLKLSTSDISDATDRLSAMKTAKENLEEVLDLYDNVSDQTTEELILETFGVMFAVSLEILILFDIGNALDLTATVGTNYVISADTSISDSDLSRSTLVDGTTSVSTVMEKYDGRLWANEQSLALLPQANNGNLEAICRSSGGTKTSDDSPGQGLVTLIGRFSTVSAKFSAALNSSSDTTASVSDATSTVESLESKISTACAAGL